MQGAVSALQSNIWKLHILYAIRGALIHVGILVVFLLSNDLTLQQVFILQASWSILQVLLELPSGYLSDRWGRKNTVVLGSVCKVLGALSYCLSTSFWGFLIAVTWLSIGSSLFSGTTEALTYDTLLELDREDEYRKIAGKQDFYRFMTEALGSILGGGLALISLRAPLWGTLFFFSIGPLVAVTLHEPSRHKLQDTQHMRAMWNIFRTAVLHNAALRGVLLLNSILITMAFALYWFTQPYQEAVGLPLALYGVMHALIVSAHAIGSRFTHTLEHWIDDRVFLVLIALSIAGSYIALGFVTALWGLIFFFLVRAAWGCSFPLTSHIINRLTTSDVRATVLSIRSLGFRLLFTMVGPLVGYAADIYTLNQAILLAGIIGTACILGVLLMLVPAWKNIPQ